MPIDSSLATRPLSQTFARPRWVPTRIRYAVCRPLPVSCQLNAGAALSVPSGFTVLSTRSSVGRTVPGGAAPAVDEPTIVIAARLAISSLRAILMVER